MATLDDADGIQVKVPEFNVVEKKVPHVFDRERFPESRKVGATSDADVVDDLAVLCPPDKGVARNVLSKLVDSWERPKAHVGADCRRKGDGPVETYEKEGEFFFWYELRKGGKERKGRQH